MAAVLDGPVVAIEGQDAGGVCGVGSVAGDTVDELGGGFAAFLIGDVTFDEKDLAEEREIEVVIEGGGGPDRAALKAPMSEGRRFTEVGLSTLCEGELEVGQQRGLIGFDGEQIVGLALLDKVGGELTLGQQGIGGDGTAGDIDRERVE